MNHDTRYAAGASGSAMRRLTLTLTTCERSDLPPSLTRLGATTTDQLIKAKCLRDQAYSLFILPICWIWMQIKNARRKVGKRYIFLYLCDFCAFCASIYLTIHGIFLPWYDRLSGWNSSVGSKRKYLSPSGNFFWQLYSQLLILVCPNPLPTVDLVRNIVVCSHCN